MYRSRTPLQDPALQVPCIKLENIVDKTISLGLSNDMNIFVLIQIYVYHVLMLSHKILINYALALPTYSRVPISSPYTRYPKEIMKME